MLPTLIKKVAGRAKRSISTLRQQKKLSRTYSKYSQFTMIGSQAYACNLELAINVGNIEGSVVECGTWKGGMIAGIAETLGNSRDYYLYDSFEGLPPAKEVDGESAIRWQNDISSERYFNNCTARIEDAKEAMNLSKAHKVHVVKGWFHETLANHPLSQSIAVLRLDGDWYESTMTCFDHLFPLVAKGGIIIVDDYYTWDGCSRAVHDYLSKHSRPERISQHGSVCYLIKSHD